MRTARNPDLEGKMQFCAPNSRWLSSSRLLCYTMRLDRRCSQAIDVAMMSAKMPHRKPELLSREES